jgi:hypothetical protein
MLQDQRLDNIQRQENDKNVKKIMTSNDIDFKKLMIKNGVKPK